MLSTLKTLLSKNPFHEMALADRKILAICMGAALVFWLILNLSRNYDITREIEVEYLVDPERVLVGRLPEELDATVSGSGWNLIWESLRPGKLPVQIDVRNRENLRLNGGELELQIKRQLSSSKLTPTLPGYESLPILTTPKEGKRVPVVSAVDVRFAEGHIALLPPEITPDSITVSGATDALEEIESWPTEAQTLKNVNTNVTEAINLQPPPEGITLSREKVGYNLTVEAFIQQSITVPVSIENPPANQNFEYSPKNVVLNISLPQSAYGSYRPEDFHLVADLSGYDSGANSNTVPLMLVRRPESVVGVQFTPKVIEYYLVD